jgi:hypothetical protein
LAAGFSENHGDHRPPLQCFRLTEHVWFSALGYEIMATWIHEKPDQAGGV